MPHTDLVVFFLLVAVMALTAAAQRLSVPYPIVLVVGGSAVGFFPGVPDVRVEPHAVLLAFLPPLLYNAAFFSSIRELRANARVIGLGAIGLVLATTAAVAAVAHAAIDGLGWPAAFALGAIVSPTDPLAAGEIFGRLGVPRRLRTVVEGEALINDGSALVVYRAAVHAATGASVAALTIAGTFAVNVAGGVAIGLAAALVISFAVRHAGEDEVFRVGASLASGYLAFLPAEAVGVSGVLAAVTTGLVLGRRAPRLSTSGSRLQASGFWGVTVFVLNATLFLLVGLQLPAILRAQSRSATDLVLLGAAVSATVVLTRMVWSEVVTVLLRTFDRRAVQRARRVSWRLRAVNEWSGLRGSVSLTAALALPDGVPDRDLLIFLTLCVIWVTLVGQGLTLPWVISRVRLEDDGVAGTEELHARKAAVRAAEEELARLDGEDWTRSETIERMRGLYAFRARRLAQRAGHADGEEDVEARSRDYQRMVRRVLEAQRRAVVDLRDGGQISDDALYAVQRELDLEEERLDA